MRNASNNFDKFEQRNISSGVDQIMNFWESVNSSLGGKPSQTFMVFGTIISKLCCEIYFHSTTMAVN